MKSLKSPTPLKRRAFTLVEMLVVILIITILIGIGLAVGTQVENSSETNLTKTELKNLQAALTWYIHKSGGQIPANMGQFLQDYQLDHATPGPSINGAATWKQTPNVLTALPPNLVISGTFPGPGAAAGTNNMTGVICVLDGFGNPIQYMPPAPNPPSLYSDPTSNSSTDGSTDWLSSATVPNGSGTPEPATSALPPITVENSTFQNGTSGWYPTTSPGSATPNYDHTPYFFSFGPGFSTAQANASNTSSTSTFGPSDYIYSYNQ